jgi:hypothetical protein
MRRMQPTAWFWIIAAAIVAVALFTVGNVYGQSAGSSAAFQGRPAMAGAQSGLGVMSGPPQGGLGPQSPEDPGSGFGARRQADVNSGAPVTGPAIPREPGPIPRDSGRDRAVGDGELRPQRDRGDVIKRDRDDHGVQQQGESAGKAKRAGKRSIERARRGVSGVDS